MSELVSVVVPCYNHEKYVQHTIESIIKQDYKNIELIIIDDGSSDNSVDKIKLLIDPCKKRFKRFEFRSRPNKGLTKTLNEALEWCKGKYFSPIASDDLMRPQRIRRQVDIFESKKLQQPNLKAVFSAYSLLDENGNHLDDVTYSNDKIVTYKNYFGRGWLCAATALIITDEIRNCGSYDESLIYEDLDIWLKLLKYDGSFFVSKENLSIYRKHSSSFSTNHTKMFTGALKVYLKHFKNPMFIPVISKLTLNYVLALSRDIIFKKK